jgi:hypothetical protein
MSATESGRTGKIELPFKAAIRGSGLKDIHYCGCIDLWGLMIDPGLPLHLGKSGTPLMLACGLPDTHEQSDPLCYTHDTQGQRLGSAGGPPDGTNSHIQCTSSGGDCMVADSADFLPTT